MRRVVAIALCLAFVAPMAGDNPPRSHAFGKSLGEWMVLYWTWALGGDQPDHVGRVTFMPIPVGEHVSGSFTYEDPGLLAGELSVTFKPGTPFVLPVAVWIGETYDPDLEIPDDPPIASSIFTGSNVLITIDGEPLIDSDVDDLSTYYFGPEYFDSPVSYDEPTSYGSIGAIFIQGIGFVHPPLSVGVHTLTLHSEILIPEYNLGVIFENQWTITVGN